MQFIGTDKNRNNFYGIRCSYISCSINDIYNREFSSNVCSNGWFTTLLFGFPIILSSMKDKNIET